MKKLSGLILTALMMVFVMGGCGIGETAPTENTITVGKDGAVKGVIVEEFDKDYYDQSSLETMISEEIQEFNKGADAVRLDTLEVDENGANVQISYVNAQTYKEFNDVEFFCGNASDAQKAGYELADVSNVKEGAAGLTASEVANSGLMLLVFEEPVCVRVSGAIRYVSTGVEVTGKKSAKAQGEGLFYILFEA